MRGNQPTPYVDLYGSLAIRGFRSQLGDSRPRFQNWARHYVSTESDVDLVVLLPSGMSPSFLLWRLTSRSNLKLVLETSVSVFSATQYNLRGTFRGDHLADEVWLDITCIESQIEFERFRCRQEAFRQSFRAARYQLETSYGADGALAFDAYIFLLKAWAGKVQKNGLSGFQAVCIGLCALQFHLDQLRCCTPTGLILFECFLRFCVVFFSDSEELSWKHLRGYRYCAIDLSLGGRLVPRISRKWKCELYFMEAEAQLQTKQSERSNVGHSIVPEVVGAAARGTLDRTCAVADGPCDGAACGHKKTRASQLAPSTWPPPASTRVLKLQQQLG